MEKKSPEFHVIQTEQCGDMQHICYLITWVLFGISKFFYYLFVRRVHGCGVQSLVQIGDIAWEEFEKVGLQHFAIWGKYIQTTIHSEIFWQVWRIFQVWCVLGHVFQAVKNDNSKTIGTLQVPCSGLNYCSMLAAGELSFPECFDTMCLKP